jgi:AbrB family looped-hinge helix DNA binding protein
MSIATATLSSKFQISIPKEIRETLNLKPGQRLAFLCVGKSVKLVPQFRIEDLFGIGKGANAEGYRDRDTRREDSLPTLTPSQAVKLKGNIDHLRAKRKA